jgi:signal transduction histidine kinase
MQVQDSVACDKMPAVKERASDLELLARRLHLHRVAGPLLLSVAYYSGAQLGFALQAPNAPQSVLWLPNSILLAALIILPVRQWPTYLAAAFPAQMLLALRVDAPTLTMGVLFLTNCADAALGALLVKRLSRPSGGFQFDGLRNTLIFALGATSATVLLSYADAGLSVATGWTDDYYAAFATRLRSNVLTHLIVVPPLVELYGVDWRRVRAARVIEALLLTALLIATCAVAFGRSGRFIAFPALLYSPLPLLLWAAVRFGPGGTGWGVLVVAFVASWNALLGRGPFTSSSPLENLVSLQLFLLASVMPLLFLAAVVRERNRATAALRTNEGALRENSARLRKLAGKLIAAQELERARIARDMHDDFNQQLAALSLSISALRRRGASDEQELHAELTSLQERTVRLTEQIRHFSHDLHPGLLDHLGLVPTLRRYCADFGQQHALQLSLTAADDLGDVPRDVALSVYRIVQEGLRNIVSHARVGAASVSLTRSSNALELTIGDRGRGFDQADVRDGIGLMSIDERARLFGGTMTITSAPDRGTRLDVRIPVVPASPDAPSPSGA